MLLKPAVYFNNAFFSRLIIKRQCHRWVKTIKQVECVGMLIDKNLHEPKILHSNYFLPSKYFLL